MFIVINTINIMGVANQFADSPAATPELGVWIKQKTFSVTL
jgi:hypothetical protein